MAGYSQSIDRAKAGGVIPVQQITEVIRELPKQSVVMNRARRVNLTSNEAKQPVLATLPEAYWVSGDTGLKQTTSESWSAQTITTEELAAIVPVPDNVIADSSVDLWGSVQPDLVEAIGAKIDSAILFGNDKPTSWPDSIMVGATTAGNIVTEGTGTDIGQDVASLAGIMARQGYTASGFLAAPDFNWRLVAMRTEAGIPLYTQNLSSTAPTGLYGYPLDVVDNGAWDPAVDLLAISWQNVIVGIRQDITFKTFTEGVITDETGKVVMNLMQQDMSALRVVFRVGYQVANPITRMEPDASKRFPAGVLTAAA